MNGKGYSVAAGDFLQLWKCFGRSRAVPLFARSTRLGGLQDAKNPSSVKDSNILTRKRSLRLGATSYSGEDQSTLNVGVRSGRKKASGQIFDQILALADVDSAWELLESRRDDFSAANSSTALKLVASLEKGPTGRGKRELIGELAALVDSKLEEMATGQLADVILACGRIGSDPAGLVDKAVARCEQQVENLTAGEVTKIMWGLAKLRRLPQSFLDRVSARVLALGLGKFSAYTISNVVWSCATLKYRNAELLEALAVESTRRMDEFAPQGICSIAWGFASLGICDTGLLDAAEAAAHPQLSNFSTQGLVNLLWAYGALGHTPHKMLDDAIAEAMARIPKGRPLDVSNLAVSCARLDAGSPDVLEAISERALEILDSFRPSSLAGLIWAMGRMKNSGISEELCHAVLSAAAGSADKIGPKEAVSIIWGVSRTIPEPDEESIAAILDRMSALLPTMDDQETLLALQSLGHLSRIVPGSAALAWTVEAANEKEIDLTALPASSSALTAWAYARMNRRVRRWAIAEDGAMAEGPSRPRRLPEWVVDAIMERLPEYGGRELSLALWAVGILRQPLAQEEVERLVQRVEELMPQLSMRQCSMCVWGLAKLQHLDINLMDLVTAVLPYKLQKACPQDMAMLMCSCAVLPYKTIPLLETCTSWSAENARHFTITDISNTLWAFAELRCHPRQVMDKFRAQLLIRFPGVEPMRVNSTLKWASKRLAEIEKDRSNMLSRRDGWFSASADMDDELWERRRRFDRIFDSLDYSSYWDDEDDSDDYYGYRR